jgi:hypothetical protein
VGERAGIKDWPRPVPRDDPARRPLRQSLGDLTSGGPRYPLLQTLKILIAVGKHPVLQQLFGQNIELIL